MAADRARMRGGGAAGFTLLELLVALAVFAMAALALERLEGLSLGQTADLDRRLLADVVAGNLAAELASDPQPPPVGQAGGVIVNAGRRFAWQRTVARDGAGDGASDGAGDLLAVTIEVREIGTVQPGGARVLRFVVTDAVPGAPA